MSVLSEYAVNLQADALSRALDGGVFRIYEGTRLLVELPFQKSAAGVAVGGVVTWRIASAEALARGAPNAYKAFTAGGELIESGTMGRSAGDLIVSFDIIEKGAKVSVPNLVHKVPR